MKFDELELFPAVMRGIKEMGFEEATPIQSKAIPVLMEGKDVIGQAQTGTGKTAAFGIPVLQKVDPSSKKTQAVILSPTRELAIQVADELRKLSKYMHGIKVLPVYGGQEITKQIRSLKGGCQIIVGTPGRIMDHLRRKTIRCEQVNTIILDEADEMLDMGFREDIETILEYIPGEHQTVLFSATMPKPILEITRKYQHDAVTIKIVKKELTVPSIEQYYYDAKRRDKVDMLTRLLDYYNPKLSLIFCNTKRCVDELTKELSDRGYFAEGLHGDMKQAQRDRVMKNFRTGKTEILIATDVAARGIDVDDVEAVFNYDLPQDEEYYVHRIGRTGRAGRNGISFSFVFGKEMRKMRDIERYTKTKLVKHDIPSVADVEEKKVSTFFNQVKEVVEAGHLTKQIQWLENFCSESESEYGVVDIAAALLKIALGDEEKQEIVEEPSRTRKEGRSKSRDTGASEGMIRLFINVGRNQRVQAKDILGAIAGEAGIPGKLVGTIDIYDKYTFVEVPKQNAKKVLEKMKDIKIKGNKINIERANRKKK